MLAGLTVPASAAKSVLKNSIAMQSLFSIYGFDVDCNEYTKTCDLGIQSRSYYIQGEKICKTSTRVMVIRSKYSSGQDYIDRVLTFTELNPLEFTGNFIKSYWTGKRIRKSYPRSLEVYCKFPVTYTPSGTVSSKVQYEGSVPKSAAGVYNSSSGFVIGGTAGTSGVGLSLNYECSKATVANVLTVRNYSSISGNYSKICFIYNPASDTVNSNMTDYIQTTTEQITTMAVESNVKNYVFTMNFTGRWGYTINNTVVDEIISNWSSLESRSFRTVFQ